MKISAENRRLNIRLPVITIILFEYENLSDAQVVPLLQKTRYLEEESDYRSTMSVPPYEQILKDYQGKKSESMGRL